MFAKFVPTAVLAAAFAFGGVAAAANVEPLKGDPKELNFGIISTETSHNLKAQWEPLLKDMEKAVGMKVNAFFAPDYAGIIEAQRFGKVHLAWYGNKSGMEAVDRAGGEVFAQQTKIDGAKGYYSHVIVPADSGIDSLAELLKCDKSLNFGIGDPNSTSGFLVPSYYVFAQNGKDPKDCFKTVRNANHETNFMAVANKQVDAATNNSEMLSGMEMRDPALLKKVKVIWTSPLIANDPLVWRKDLSPALKTKIRDFFVNYGVKGDNAEEAKKVLAAMGGGLGPFIASSDAQLLPIRQLELFKTRAKVESDGTLSAADKSKKLAEIDAKLSELNAQLAKKGT